MMPPRLDFDAAVSAWVKQADQRMTAVFRESTMRLIDEMQTPVGAGGNMPVDTGFLRASLRVYIGRTQNMASISNTGKGSSGGDALQYAMTIASAKLGDTINAVYLANYAQRVENGFVGQDSLGRSYNQSGRHFVKLAAQRWPTIVRTVCAELKSRNTP